nr:Biomphalaria glabrata neurotrophin-3-like; transcript variant X2 [Biomphalaria glabrata]
MSQTEGERTKIIENHRHFYQEECCIHCLYSVLVLNTYFSSTSNLDLRFLDDMSSLRKILPDSPMMVAMTTADINNKDKTEFQAAIVDGMESVH